MISQCKIVLEDPIATPEAYPLSVTTMMMSRSNGITCQPNDPTCPTTDLSSPNTYNCGQICTSDNGVFTYTFKGVQFLIYGVKKKDYGKFDVYINDTKISEVDENDNDQSEENSYALLYTSQLYEYGEHTIKMQGKGTTFRIFKIAYWPHTYARRLNISDMTSFGSWTPESDKIGGDRVYSTGKDARKSFTIQTSKLWVYGTEASNHGMLNIKFDTLIDKDVNTKNQNRVDGKLLFESDDMPFSYHQLDLTATTSTAVLIYCVYYLYDPPKQTMAPNPSKTKIPDTSDLYIDKTYTGTLDNGTDQITVGPGQAVKQVFGCTFINIESGRIYFIKFNNGIPFFNNIVEFTVSNANHIAPLFIPGTGNGNVEIIGCTFVKCNGKNNEANVMFCRAGFNIAFKDCRFINCGYHSTRFIINTINEGSFTLKLIDCSFQFDIETSASTVLKTKCQTVIIDGCTFSKCPILDMDLASTSTTGGELQFTNNYVFFANRKTINAANLNTKINISGNKFHNNNLNGESFINLVHKIDEVELFNNTFLSLTSSGTDGKYGGGSSLLIQRSDTQKSKLTINQCIFRDNNNNFNNSPYNQGGAFQFGYSSNAANSELNFLNCDFISNNCPNGKGGAIGVNINQNLVLSGCNFEANVAGQEGGAIYIWGKTESNEGTLQMEKIVINDCHFTSNKGSNGNAIYIESENIEPVKLEVTRCTFTNNGEDQSKSLIVSYSGNVLLTKTMCHIQAIANRVKHFH